jgi:hypothetical protein
MGGGCGFRLAWHYEIRQGLSSTFAWPLNPLSPSRLVDWLAGWLARGLGRSREVQGGLGRFREVQGGLGRSREV